jgi:hypothetical protein
MEEVLDQAPDGSTNRREFSITATRRPSGVLVNISPLAEPLTQAYIGVALDLLAKLRPRVAVGESDRPPADAAFESRCLIDYDEAEAVFHTQRDVPVGQAVFIWFRTDPPRFVFGSAGGSRFYSHPTDPNFGRTSPTLDEWMKQADEPQAASPEQPTELHPNAAQSFDDHASALVRYLSPHIPRLTRGALTAPLHVPDVVQAIGPIKSESPVLSEEGYKSVEDRDGRLALFGSAYLEFRRLAIAVQRAPAYRDVLSDEFVRQNLFDWLVATQRGRDVECSYTEHLKWCSDREIKTYEVWVPLQRVFVEQPFPIGRVQCRTIRPELFNESLARSLSKAKDQEDRKALEAYFDKLRRRHQGYAAMVCNVTAEPRRAFEVGWERAQQACDVLRLYDPAVFRLAELSACVPFGGLFQPEQHAL